MSRRDSVCSERGKTIGSPTSLNYTKAGPGTGSMASMKLTIPQQLASVTLTLLVTVACLGAPEQALAGPATDGPTASEPDRPDREGCRDHQERRRARDRRLDDEVRRGERRRPQLAARRLCEEERRVARGRGGDRQREPREPLGQPHAGRLGQWLGGQDRQQATGTAADPGAGVRPDLHVLAGLLSVDGGRRWRGLHCLRGLGQNGGITALDGPTFLAKDRSPSVTYRDGTLFSSDSVWGAPSVVAA